MYSYYSVIISSFISNSFAMIIFLIVEKEILNIKSIFSKEIYSYFLSFLFSFALIFFLNKLNIDQYNIVAIFIGLIFYLSFLWILRDKFIISFINTLKSKA